MKAGAVMEGSRVGYPDWITPTFLLSTSLKGAALMALHRNSGITQKSAWFLAHGVRTALS